jgi:hypothetical protein
MATWTTMTDLSAGDLVTEADMDAIRGNIEYLLNPNNNGVVRASGYNTTSTSFVDVDATNVKATILTNGGPVLVWVSASFSHSANFGVCNLDIAVDGSRQGSTGGLLASKLNSLNAEPAITIAILATGLSAASHTFKLQWKTNAGTLTLRANVDTIIIRAIEL